MALFGFGKKKESPSCGCECRPVPEAREDGKLKSGEEIRSVRVLGTGCVSCHTQYENAKAAVKDLGLDLEVEYITDMEKIMSYGVMSMPALVVNDQVVSMGKVLKAEEVEKKLRQLQG